MKNILITGSNGQLGSEIRAIEKEYPQYKFHFTDVAELNICDKEAIERYTEDAKINSIINCAAYTAVDKAESELELADKINHIAVKNLAEVSKQQNIQFIHISTDYVFDGQANYPYPVDYPTKPQNVYGVTKLKGENSMKEMNLENSFLIRTAWVYSSFGNNFVKTMLKLGKERDELNVIYDQVGTPTYAADLAKFIVDNLIEAKSTEVKTYHFTNEGVCSWYDFAKAIMELSNTECKINPIPTKSYPTPAKRPHYSVLNKESLKQDFQTEIPYWKDSLKTCLQKLKINH